jgi:hypothetical protein
MLGEDDQLEIGWDLLNACRPSSRGPDATNRNMAVDLIKPLV